MPKLKYADFCTVNMFNTDDFFLRVDIKSGHHHINILEEHQKFLGFSWAADGVTRYFKFTVLIFWISKCTICFYKSSKSVNQTLEEDWH